MAPIAILLISAVSNDAILTAFLANGERYKEWHFVSHFDYESSALTLNTKLRSPRCSKNCSSQESKAAKPGENA